MTCHALTSVQSGFLGRYAAEMILFLFKIAESMLEPSMRLYIYEGICLQEIKSHHKCNDLERYPVEEGIVQNKCAHFLMFYKVLLNVPAIIMVLFCGAWSDRFGRKLPVMLTCFGGVVSVLLYMVSSQLRGHGQGPFLYVVLVGAGVRSIFGRSAVMTMACHSYVADISSSETRTRKLGHLVAMSHFGYLFGCTMAGALLDITSFLVIFCVVTFIQSVCFLVASLCMRETIMTKPVPSMGNADPNESELTCCRQITACKRVITKPRRGTIRCCIIVLLIAGILQQTCKSGEMDMVILYVKRAPLSWMRSTYSYLLACDYACMGFMAFFVLPVVIRCCGMTDVSLIIIGLVFKFARTMMYAFSNKTWMMFTAVAIGGPHSFAVSGIKSLLSKLVDEDEIGKTFSIISSLETISNLVGTVIFTNVYVSTISIWPGFGFTLEAFFYLCLLILMVTTSCGALEHIHQLIMEKNVKSESTPNDIENNDETTPILVKQKTECLVYSYDFDSSGVVDMD